MQYVDIYFTKLPASDQDSTKILRQHRKLLLTPKRSFEFLRFEVVLINQFYEVTPHMYLDFLKSSDNYLCMKFIHFKIIYSIFMNVICDITLNSIMNLMGMTDIYINHRLFHTYRLLMENR